MRGHRHGKMGRVEKSDKPKLELIGSTLKLFSYLLPHWWIAAVVFLMTITTTALELVRPRLIRILLDDAIPQGDLHVLNLIALAFLGVILGGAILQFAGSYLRHRLGQQVIKKLRTDLYEHLQNLSLTFYENQPTGEIMSRVVNDAEAVENLIVHTLENLLSSILILVGVATILFLSDARLAALTLIPIPLLVLTIVLFARKFHGLFRDVREKTAHLNTFLQERISGVRIVKAFASEQDERERFDRRAQDYFDARMRAIFGFSTFRPLIMVFGAAGTLLVIFFGGHLAIDGNVSVGQLVEFVMYLGFFYMPIRRLGFLFGHELPRGLAAGDRVFEFLNTQEKLPVPAEPASTDRLDGRINFDSVTFSYDQETVLRDLRLTVDPGETLALVGRSGVGKTTLVDLVSRFYDPDAGTVHIDGVDARQYDPAALRRHIGVVLQEPFLFNSSIRDNIAYARPGASDSEVIRAAQMAGAQDFIDDLPDGLDSVVGERGVKLSVGQKQRVSIARALLKDPSILVLDEATSSVDTETEMIIQEALERAAEGRTTIIIAHRLSTTTFADSVAVLHNGKIIETGSPDELLQNDSHYSRLWNMQFPDSEQ
ncbi:MAG: ABC transporter ATP-binding protein [Planctomycetota bacterium]